MFCSSCLNHFDSRNLWIATVEPNLGFFGANKAWAWLPKRDSSPFTVGGGAKLFSGGLICWKLRQVTNLASIELCLECAMLHHFREFRRHGLGLLSLPRNVRTFTIISYSSIRVGQRVQEHRATRRRRSVRRGARVVRCFILLRGGRRPRGRQVPRRYDCASSEETRSMLFNNFR